MKLRNAGFRPQVQSTSWMPHQQYVMQPTVSAAEEVFIYLGVCVCVCWGREDTDR